MLGSDDNGLERQHMPLAPIELPGQRSRAQELYARLRTAILSGELQPRERLVETTVAECAGVSRTPVREALHRLEIDGLVHETEGGGVEVSGFSLDELADLCAVRETLEAMATQLAAKHRSELELATLRSILAEEERTDAADAERQVELNHVFHETLWRASRNRYLTSQLQQLREMIEHLQGSTLRLADRTRAALDEHREIVEAIARGAPDDAEGLARLHFRNAMAARLAMGAHRPPPVR
jgi:DNA-binding GntR family transcriptional regulator